MAHETLEKFGYPQTVVHETERWAVLTRPKQVTLGSLVLACKEKAESLGEISIEASTELQSVVHELETALDRAFANDKINYLMLMMVDRHVHFHVIPRYAESRSFAGQDFPDPGWPRQPRMGESVPVTPERLEEIRVAIADSWPR